MQNSIYQNLLSANIAALKNKAEDSVIIRGVISTAIAESSRQHKTPSDDVVIKTLKKMVESNLTVIPLLKEDDFRRAALLKENEVLNSFLPKQLTSEQIAELIKENNFVSIAQVMSWFKTNYANCYDGSAVRDIFNSIKE